MDEFCKCIGIFVITAATFAVPILCTCSIALGWSFDAKAFFIFLSVIDYIVIYWYVHMSIE